MDFDIRSQHEGDTCAVKLAGELDVYSAPRLKDAMASAIDSGCVNVVIDLCDVTFIDSSGLGVIVGGLQKVRLLDGSMRIVCDNDSVLKIFKLTGLDKVFAIYSDMSRARDFQV